MDYKLIAINLYDYCEDMDYEDYEDTKGETIDLMASALEKIGNMEGEDFKTLMYALRYAFGEE